MARLALALVLCVAGCDEQTIPTQPTTPALPPVAPNPPTACQLFDAILRIDRELAAETATISGGPWVEVEGYGVKASPARYELPLGRTYQVRATDSRGCWSRYQPLIMAPNPVALVPVQPKPQPKDDPRED